ncbi:MAG TPA: hypothetical protein VHH73_13325 [Verrucomicrobiae bacterium]|nr:hypothetical protein [Verrucomicrobiae bacterium]
MSQPWFLTLSRVAAGLVTLVYLTPFAVKILVVQLVFPFDWLNFTFGVVSATLAFLGGWFALLGGNAASRRRMKYAVAGGLIFFAIGFALGFLGPMMLKPQANQGPLLGIFFTGPLSFPLGAVAGLAYERIRGRNLNV